MANVITGIRIICAVALIFCPIFSICFYVLYFVCGISDVLDGAVARKFEKGTKFGAQFDTVADIIFAAVVLIKLIQAIYIPMWLIIWTACIAAIKCINIVCGFVIHKRFVSEHTLMNKICGILLFAIPICAGCLSWRLTEVLIIFTCAMATVAALQEGYYICRDRSPAHLEH